MSVLPPCSIVTLLRYVSIELKELLTYLLTYLSVTQQWCPASAKVTVGLASHWPCMMHHGLMWFIHQWTEGL